MSINIPILLPEFTGNTVFHFVSGAKLFQIFEGKQNKSERDE